MVLTIKDLSLAKRAALETLLDRPVQDSEAVSLNVFEQVTVTPEQRFEIVNVLEICKLLKFTCALSAQWLSCGSCGSIIQRATWTVVNETPY